MIKYYLVLFSLFFSTIGFSQLSANFTFNKTKVCAPELVQFIDNSTGNPDSYRWEFSNGVVSSNKNPSIVFTKPGIITVKFIVFKGGDSDTSIVLNAINVFAPPIADFNVNKTDGCIPLNVNFTDLSIPQSGAISSWFWSFGNGQTSTAQFPSQSYSEVKSNTVFLKVTDQNGCSATKTKKSLITVGGPKADFVYDSLVCGLPANVGFINTSVGENLSYFWDFGDGVTSTNELPGIHTYSSFATTFVQLIVKEAVTNCSDTLSKKIQITNYQSTFDYNVICSPSDFKIDLKTTTVPNPVSVLWTFDDNTTSTQFNLTKDFSSRKKQKIILKSTIDETCFDTTSITYTPTVANFLSSSEECNPPMIIDFENASLGSNLNYIWNFGDSTFSDETNPIHLYQPARNRVNVNLKATDDFGCESSITKRIDAPFPIADFYVVDSVLTGCAPLTVSFIDSISYVLDSTKIVSVYWDFGDPISGMNNTSTDTIPTHVYLNPGEYTITYVITLDNGCVDTVIKEDFILVGEKPDSVSYSVTPNDTICYGENIQYEPILFKDGSVFTSNYHCWLFDSERNSLLIDSVTAPNNCPNPQKSANRTSLNVNFFNPIHSYSNYTYEFRDTINGEVVFGDANSSSGLVYTQLITGYNGCFSSVVDSQFIHPTFAMMGFVFDNDSSDLFLEDTSSFIKVFNNSSGYDVFDYFKVTELATGTIVFNLSETDTTTLKFTKPGIYDVELSVSNSINNCTDIVNRRITVDNPIFKIEFSNNACLSSKEFVAMDKSSFDFNSNLNRTWIVNDSIQYKNIPFNTRSIKPDSVVLNSLDTGWNIITLQTIRGGKDNLLGDDNNNYTVSYETKDSIYIQGTKSIGSLDTNFICYRDSIFFSTITKSTSNIDSIVWNYGNGEFANRIDNHKYSYQNSGEFFPSYIVFSDFGCKDTFYLDTIKVSGPVVDFAVNDTLVCVDEEVAFTNLSIGDNLSFRWETGGVEYFNIDINHQYTSSGKFNVKLFAQDIFGCKDSIFQLNLVEVADIPVPKFSADSTIGKCPPLIVNFVDSTLPSGNQWNWDFGDGDFSTTKNTLHTYSVPGIYSVELTVTNYAGCVGVLNKDSLIKVQGPSGNVIVSDLSLCLPDSVEFNGDFINTKLFVWDFNDGDIISFETNVDGDSVVHSYQNGGRYLPSLLLIDSNNCQFQLPLDIEINADSVLAKFDISDSIYCDLSAIQTINKSRASLNPNYFWSFGNNDTSSEFNPLISYQKGGDYTIRLKMISPIGCVDSISKSISVFDDPDEELTLSNDNFCVPSSTIFKLQLNNSEFLADSIIYTLDGKLYSDQVSLNIQKATTLSLGYEIYYGGGKCLSDSVIEFKYYDVPEADFDYFPKNISLASSEVNFIAEASATTNYNWIFYNSTSNVQNPTKFFDTEGTYDVVLIASNEGNCVDTVIKSITISPYDFIKLPNAFTPDGDGVDDDFGILFAGDLSIKSFKVYNQWGNLVFETNSINQRWDGTKNGKLQPNGSYVYIVVGVDVNGKEIESVGNFVLIR